MHLQAFKGNKCCIWFPDYLLHFLRPWHARTGKMFFPGTTIDITYKNLVEIKQNFYYKTSCYIHTSNILEYINRSAHIWVYTPNGLNRCSYISYIQLKLQKRLKSLQYHKSETCWQSMILNMFHGIHCVFRSFREQTNFCEKNQTLTNSTDTTNISRTIL